MKSLLFIPSGWKIGAQMPLFEEFSYQFATSYYTGTVDESTKYDYIYVQSGAVLPSVLKTIKEANGAFVIQWTGDCREELLHEVIANEGIADITFLASGIAQKEMYEKALKGRVEYLQHAVSPFHFMPVREKMQETKIVFIGNNYGHFSGGRERAQTCALLSSNYVDFEVIGNGFEDGIYNNSRNIPFDQVTSVYNNSFIGISSSIFNDKEGYWSNRPLLIMAAGCCCLMKYSPGLEKYFNDWEHCVFYRDDLELVRNINYLKDHNEIRDKIAYQGQVEVRKNHQHINRVKQIISFL